MTEQDQPNVQKRSYNLIEVIVWWVIAVAVSGRLWMSIYREYYHRVFNDTNNIMGLDTPYSDILLQVYPEAFAGMLIAIFPILYRFVFSYYPSEHVRVGRQYRYPILTSRGLHFGHLRRFRIAQDQEEIEDLGGELGVVVF